ncbi:MAG: hypothetical protein GYB33_06990 [Gammaproteobacteria bacterium]|uniref:MauE/DoxX family redox-associated membrane protein n=1 Tax=Pseudomaricurvus alcaniphilus TaxID=1166482 RepID=UPI001408C3F3|nr:MauE/DoxX family redox-associated membrane protein [Pseudomaricurvus alcaniphilus]MBR9910082.1 hypothetical protein [Gammaproteobacteria bacterium]NHN36598.1 hypothetical protein [Pseudomaricurvus alcaniphilus]
MQTELMLSNTLAFFLLWLLAAAGLHKLLPANAGYFQQVLRGYGIPLPWLARCMPLLGLLEIGIGIALVVPASRVAGGIAAGALLSAYLLLLVRQLLRGQRGAKCGCAGPDSDLRVGPALLARNAILVLMALLVAQLAAGVGSGAFGYWLLSLLAASMLVVVYLSAEQLLKNAQWLQRIEH